MKKNLKTMICIVAIMSMMCSYVFAQKDSLVIGVHKDENNLTPFTYVTGTPGLDLVNLVFDKLFIFDKDNKVVPWMVDDYKVSDDYKTYDIKLKSNLKWHDGKDLTSDDVKFSFEYALSQKNATFRKIASRVENIKIKDKLNLTMTLKQSEFDFLRDSLASFFIVPKHIYEGVSKAEQVKDVVGSGIYKLKEYKVGEYYKFEAFEDYHKGVANVKELYMPIITDKSATFQAIKNKEIATSTLTLSPELVDTFKNDSNIGILNGAGLSTTLLQFNTQKYPLNDKNIRKAISSAIDIDEIINTVMLGYAKVGNQGFFSNELDYSNKDLKHIYNVNEANGLLDRTEFNKFDENKIRINSNGDKLEFEFLVYSSSPLRIRMAEMISNNLKNIGINAKVVSLDATTVDELVWPGFDVSKGRNYDMAMWGWSPATQLSPTNIISLGHSDTAKGTYNVGGFKSEEFDNLCNEFSNTLDEAKRSELLNSLEKIIADEVPFVTLLNEDIISVYNKSLNDAYVMQTGFGVINRFSFLSETSNSSKEKTSNYTYILGLVVLLGGAFYIFKKKRA